MNKCLLVTVFFFIFSICCFANRKVEKQLLGSWKMIKKDSAGFVLTNTSTTQFFSFYKSGHFQINDVDIVKDSTQKIYGQRFYYGKWEINRKNDSLSIRKSFPLMGLIEYDKNYKILKLSDSVLVLSYSKRGIAYQSQFVRVVPIAQMVSGGEINFVKVKKKDFVLDDRKFVLVNSADTTKKVLISASERIDVTIEEPTSDTTIESYESSTGGEIVGITDSAIQLNIYQYKTSIFYKNDSSKTLVKNYNEVFIKTIEYKKISSFSYISKKQERRNVVFGGISTFAGLNLLFIAPLVSINYLKGGFNSKRYFTWAGISLLTMGISIPISAIGTERSFKLTRKNLIADPDYWYFDN